MTQQIINTGTGPDSYTGDTVRNAFTKVNSNFAELYNDAGLTGNISGNTVTATGNITSNGYFLGNGSQLTGVRFGNLYADGTVGQSIYGTVDSNNIVLVPLQSGVIFNLSNPTVALSSNVFFRQTATNAVSITTGSASIAFQTNTGRLGFGRNFSAGYQNAFNGSLYADEFYVNANMPTGYQFNTSTGLTGISHSYQNDVNGNISLVRITHDTSIPAKFYDNNTTLLSGNLVVSSNNAAGTFPNAFVQTYSNVNSYSQLIYQNINSGSDATSDLVVTADTGTDSTYYLDMGLAGSGYDNTTPTNSLGTSIYPLDAYIYTQGNSGRSGGNLTIGTTSTNTAIRLLVGGGNMSNVAANITTTGVSISQALTVAGNTIIGHTYIPSTAASTGTAGQIVWDSNYVYVCVAANTWKRANISTW
jgi:hypothetical protein